MPDTNLYKVLQVDPAADADVITAVYRVLAARNDPNHDHSGDVAVRRLELDRAFAVLSDPEQRATYDAERQRIAFRVTNENGAGEPRRGGLAERIAANAAQSGATDDAAEQELDFGRYAGRTLREILHLDADYLRWLSRHSSGIRYRSSILRLLAQAEAERRPVASPSRSG